GQIQLILLRFNSEKLRFTWLARAEIIPTSFENHDVGSMIEIYLIVKEIMKENYEVILKIIQEIERNSSQEGSIQAIDFDLHLKDFRKNILLIKPPSLAQALQGYFY
ncbi:21132_t:CDS:2, partial [Gigaspora margarita]